MGIVDDFFNMQVEDPGTRQKFNIILGEKATYFWQKVLSLGLYDDRKELGEYEDSFNSGIDSMGGNIPNIPLITDYIIKPLLFTIIAVPIKFLYLAVVVVLYKAGDVLGPVFGAATKSLGSVVLNLLSIAYTVPRIILYRAPYESGISKIYGKHFTKTKMAKTLEEAFKNIEFKVEDNTTAKFVEFEVRGGPGRFNTSTDLDDDLFEVYAEFKIDGPNGVGIAKNDNIIRIMSISPEINEGASFGDFSSEFTKIIQVCCGKDYSLCVGEISNEIKEKFHAKAHPEKQPIRAAIGHSHKSDRIAASEDNHFPSDKIVSSKLEKNGVNESYTIRVGKDFESCKPWKDAIELLNRGCGSFDKKTLQDAVDFLEKDHNFMSGYQKYPKMPSEKVAPDIRGIIIAKIESKAAELTNEKKGPSLQ
ncbi:MAG: hypothetical protein HON78_00225 [Legionellales bacterium]|jgi:hypothetical protein|nr:hypothetical protein [Legionellales bacterium]